MDTTIEYVILVLQSIVIPWLVQIERRLSRLEGYLRGLRNGA